MEEELQLPCPGSSGHDKTLGGQPWRSVCIFPLLDPRTCPVLERPAVREEDTASLAVLGEPVKGRYRRMGIAFLGQQALWRPGVNSGHRPYLEEETQLSILVAQSDQSSGSSH